MSSITDLLPSLLPPPVDVVNAVSSAPRVLIQFVSPKQSMRVEPLNETAIQFASQIKSCIRNNLIRLSPIWPHTFSKIDIVHYVDALILIMKVSSTSDFENLDHYEVEKIRDIFILAPEENLSRYDLYIHTREDKYLAKLHNILKDALNILDDRVYKPLQRKLIEWVSRPEQQNGQGKLNLNDFCIMAKVTNSIDLLKPFHTLPSVSQAYERWTFLDDLLKRPFFDDLRTLCKQSRAPGTIFLGDYRTVHALNEANVSCVKSLTQLFMGRLCHIGIFVDSEEKGLHLSHVNLTTNTHAVTPVRNPLILPFTFGLTLDIQSLIPTHLPEDLQESLKRIFSEEFQKLACQPRPELPLANSREHFNILIDGHYSPYPVPLDQLDYPPAGTPLLCSSYIGITFLIAIQRVNEALMEFGFDERIPHPFGEHEDLMNLDILRLLYLWQRINVIQPSLFHPKVHEVVSSSCESELRALFQRNIR